MHPNKTQSDSLEVTDIPALVAIAVAAHRVGDLMLERVAIRQLNELGIRLSFIRGKGGEHDAR